MPDRRTATDPPVRPDLLDPGTRDPATRHLVDQWLTYHETFCLQPVEAVRRLIDAQGDPARALARSGERPRLRGADLPARRAVLAQIAAVLLPYPSPRYPSLLRPIADPPPILVVRGSPDALEGPAVAIVGARAATAYGLGVARDLAAGLARRGIVVVSGLARGIDAAAHQGALEAGGRTVAVQACGSDITYPPEHRALADRIAAAGAVISELPPGRPPRAMHFPLRNRLISGLSHGVVVVEARPRSGSLITARHALDQGREVLAVPGPVTAPTSAGPNALLRDGARPVTALSDVFEAVGLGDATLFHPDPGRPRASATASGASGEERRILDRLRQTPCTRSDLMEALDLSPREIALWLLGLEIDGRVVEDRDGRLRVVARDLF